jgi:hypothetical protein
MVSSVRSAEVTGAGMKAAVVPNANVYFFSDAAAARGAEIQKKIDKMREEMQADAADTNKALMLQQKMEEIIEALGITQEDIAGMLFSMSLEGIDFESMPNWNQVQALIALSLEKPLAMDGVKVAVNRIAAESGLDLMHNQTEYRGAPMLSVMSVMEQQNPAIPREVFIALPEGGKVVYFGLEDSVKSALNRLADGTGGELTPAMTAARKDVPGTAQSFLLFVPTDVIRTKLGALGAKAGQQNPMMAQAMQALGGMNHLLYSAEAGTKLDMLVAGDFKTAQQAMQMKSMVDMAVLGMAKMMIMQAVGRPIPLVESLKSSQQNTEVNMEFSLTEEDLKAFMELQAAGGMPFPGAPQPPPMPPANQQMRGVPAPAPAD